MKIVADYPPNFDSIDRKLGPLKHKAILFSYGDTIYNPENVFIPPQLIAHEEVHSARQGTDIIGWWEKYLNDPKFRLTEEIQAHQAEYNYLLMNAANRNDRRSALKHVARRLAAPLYGNIITIGKAKKELNGL